MVFCDQPSAKQHFHSCSEGFLLFLIIAVYNVDQHHVLWHTQWPFWTDYGPGYSIYSLHFFLGYKKKQGYIDFFFFFSIQPKQLNSFCKAFLELCLLNTIRLLLVLGDGQNDLPVFLLFTGHFEFTWQQFMIGIQSSLLMFPINILIVSIFRHTRPREPCCCKSKRDTPDMPGRTCFSAEDTQAVNDIVTLETVMKVCVLLVYRGVIINIRYSILFSSVVTHENNICPSFVVGFSVVCFFPQDITRITHLLSKTVKSNIPCKEFGPEQQTDINAVLSVVEGFIKQSNKTNPRLPGESLQWRGNSNL